MSASQTQHLQYLELFREDARERLSALGKTCAQIERSGADPELGKQMLRDLHTIKGQAAMMGFESTNVLAHGLEDFLRAGGADPARPASRRLLLRGLDLLAALVERPAEAPAPELDELLGELAGAGETPAIPPPAPAIPPPAPAPEPAPAIPPPPPAPEPARPEPRPPRAAEPEAAAARRSGGIRVPLAKLDRLRDISGELLLTTRRLDAAIARARRQLGGGEEQELRNDQDDLARLVAELESLGRALRMVPMRTLLEQFPRAVRELARDLGRELRLVTEGEDVEVDRHILDQLAEPLLHLVRNAADHGIEDSSIRSARGKPAHGTITIRAGIAGQEVVISVADDGGGIDLARLRRRVVEMGLADRKHADEMEARTLMSHMFTAGLSTRSEPTRVSGRGIGLDVVRSRIQALGGDVDVSSEPGHGTVFRLRAPASTAVMHAISFRVGQACYGFPKGDVEAILDRRDCRPYQGLDGPVLLFGEERVPIRSAAQSLAVDGDVSPGGRVLVVRSAGRKIALDGVHDVSECEAVLRSAGWLVERHRLVNAVFPLPGGSLALMLRAGALMGAANGEERAAPPAVGPAKGPPTALVIDDSVFVRQMVADTLRSHGLIVVEAADGEEGLERLAATPEVALVVSDLEMPRLDGYGFVQRMRARSERRIPVVMLTTRSAESDRSRAFDLGVDAYVVKGTARDLWKAVGRAGALVTIRLLLVDHSAAVRRALRALLSRFRDIDVIGEAADAEQAVSQAAILRPDVIAMDPIMPGGDGVQAIRMIMERSPAPIVVLSDPHRDPQGLSASVLALGAIDLFPKPSGPIGDAVLEELVTLLRATSRLSAGVLRKRPGGLSAIGVVASTGAPSTLKAILRGLPADFPCPIVVVQHTAAGFTPTLAEWLAQDSELPVSVASDRLLLRPALYLAPEGVHTEITAGGAIRLRATAPVEGHRPSGSVLLRSLARAYGSRSAGVILSGIGRDGAAGAEEITRAGGVVLVEDPALAVAPGMPSRAFEAAPRALVQPGELIGQTLCRIAGAAPRAA
jgi:chemotaxis protein histidine kinase CheA/chemotaxis response regulator CheB